MMKFVRSRFLRLALPASALFLLASTGFAQDVTPKLTLTTPKFCGDPRPEMCMEIYQPVCGTSKDGSHRTYGNSCHACADAAVISYLPGACKKD
jgi:hypothetical protein